MQTKIKLLIFLLFVGIFLPVFSTHAGLVPCGLSEGKPEEMVPCTLCHLIIGIFNIFSWFKTILITVAAVGIFIAGVMYIISSGDEEMMKRAKSFLTTSLTGFTIVLGAWLIVNSVMWILSYDIKNLGIKQENWYTFSCDTKSSATTPSTSLPCSCANFVTDRYIPHGSATQVIDENACQINCADSSDYNFNNTGYKKVP